MPVQIRRDHAEQGVAFSCHDMAFDHFRTFSDGAREMFDGLRILGERAANIAGAVEAGIASGLPNLVEVPIGAT